MTSVNAELVARTHLISELFTAVSEGNLYLTKKILGNDFPKQTFKNISSTLLHQAANKEHASLIRLLVDFGAFVDCQNAEQMTPLHVSASKGDLESLITLINYRSDVNSVDYDHRTPLYLASYGGHIECVKTLLHHSNIDMSVSRKGGWTSLHEVARFGHYLCLKILIEAGVNINAKTDDAWWTPGHMCASNGRVECLKTLIDHGIDVNAGAGPHHTSTLLHEAAYAGHNECVVLLLEHGADPTLFTDKYLPHHLACQSGRSKCLESILTYLEKNNKSDLINAFTNIDLTTNSLSYHNALHMSALYGHEECIQVLIRHGAKHLPNNIGLYPLTLAAVKMHINCLKILLKDIKRLKQIDTSLLKAIGDFKALHHLCSKTFKITPKTIACACVLLNSGIIDINYHDELWDVSPCLYLATRNGAIELVEYLLNSGAEPKYSQKLNEHVMITDNIKACTQLLEKAQRQPKTLLLSCRLKIRNLMIRNDLKRIYELSIPRFLQNYVFHGHDNSNGLCDLDGHY